MRDYEVVYIFRPELESDAVDDRLESFHDRLDGEVTAVEHWGQRELAYEIQDERRGYYAVVQFRAEPGSISEFEQALEHDEDLIRHLLVISEGELPTPPSERREEEDEEDEEDEAEEEDDEDEDEPEPEEDDEGGGEEAGAADDEEEEADADGDDEDAAGDGDDENDEDATEDEEADADEDEEK